MMRSALSLFLTLFVATVPIRAQESASHRSIPDWSRNDPAGAAEMANRLRQHFGQPTPQGPTADPELVRQLLERIQRMTPEQAEEAIRNNPELAGQARRMTAEDPELARQLREMAARNRSGAELDRSVVERILQRIQEERGANPPSSTGGPSPGRPVGPPTPPIQSSRLGSRDSTRPSPPQPGGPPRPNVPQPPTGDDQRSERFKEFVRRLDQMMPGSVRNSDAMKRVGERIRNIDWGKVGRSKIIPDSLRPKLDLSRRLNRMGRALDRAMRRMEGRRLPNLPNINAPRLPAAPNFGAPSGPSSFEAGGAFTVLVTVGVLLLAGFLIWKLLVQPMRTREKVPTEWEPGTWPVEPESIRTREDLVRAFDHLALVRAGRLARHWHHQQIANRLGSDETRRVMALRLARLYEQARYAPPQEPLADAQLDVARRDLQTLAGATAP